jgi:hypothetical protein
MLADEVFYRIAKDILLENKACAEFYNLKYEKTLLSG